MVLFAQVTFIFHLIKKKNVCMGACLFHACVVSPEARRGHWVSLGLELQIIESCPVDVGPWRSLAVPGKGLFDHPQAEDAAQELVPAACPSLLTMKML